jgi:hypothetical protein
MDAIYTKAAQKGKRKIAFIVMIELGARLPNRLTDPCTVEGPSDGFVSPLDDDLLHKADMVHPALTGKT